MSTISKEYRDRAKDAAERAKTAHSDGDGYVQRKRQKALNEMADNENWLDGEPKEYTETVNDHRQRPRDPSQPT